jgi:hypothetical protein
MMQARQALEGGIQATQYPNCASGQVIVFNKDGNPECVYADGAISGGGPPVTYRPTFTPDHLYLNLMVTLIFIMILGNAFKRKG